MTGVRGGYRRGGRGWQAGFLWRLIWVSTLGNETHVCPIGMQLDTKQAT